MTSVTVSFVHTTGFNFFADQKGVLRTERKNSLLLLLFGSKYCVTNSKYYSLLNILRKYFLSPLPLKFLPTLKEVAVPLSDSCVGLQHPWVTLTPVICPPASMSWVWGMAACTEGCWEGWLGC